VAQQLQLRYSPERHLEPASLTLRVPPSVFLILRLVTQGWFYTRPPCALKRSFRSFRSSSFENHLVNIYLGHLSKGYAG